MWGFCHHYNFRFKFDDERVTKEDTKRALEEQYGGEEEVMQFFWDIHALLSFVCIIFFSILIYLLLCFNFDSYLKQILATIMLHLNSQNTQMRICLFTYEKMTKIRLSAT